MLFTSYMCGQNLCTQLQKEGGKSMACCFQTLHTEFIFPEAIVRSATPSIKSLTVIVCSLLHFQAQLRAFIPEMLKYSTGRGKPGWGKESCKPIWWPEDIPWANVRSDVRTEEQKQRVVLGTHSRTGA